METAVKINALLVLLETDLREVKFAVLLVVIASSEPGNPSKSCAPGCAPGCAPHKFTEVSKKVFRVFDIRTEIIYPGGAVDSFGFSDFHWSKAMTVTTLRSTALDFFYCRKLTLPGRLGGRLTLMDFCGAQLFNGLPGSALPITTKITTHFTPHLLLLANHNQPSSNHCIYFYRILRTPKSHNRWPSQCRCQLNLMECLTMLNLPD